MPGTNFLDWIQHRPTQSNQAFFLPPNEDTAPIAAPGYFQMRLTQMRLTDDRRWFKEIVPAAFVITEFNYGTERARRPFFVSNGLLPFMPAGVNADQLRVNFRDTLVLGPTPITGGDVVLFVGLFQMAIKDQRKSAFSLLEKLFQVIPGPVGSYLKLADKLTEEISACLSDENLSFLLGDQSTLGDELPRAGYQVYVKANGAPLDKDKLVIVEGALMQKESGQLVAVTDRDYCFVKVEHLAQRSDYASLPFHAVFESARQSLVKGDGDTARLQMLECIGMVYGSLDLSEDDKARLIAFYQAKLLAIQTVRGGAPDGAPSPVLRMQARALQVGGLEGKALAGSLDLVRDLHTAFKKDQTAANAEVTNDDVLRYLDTPAPAQRVSAAALMKAVAAGSLVG